MCLGEEDETQVTISFFFLVFSNNDLSVMKVIFLRCFFFFVCCKYQYILFALMISKDNLVSEKCTNRDIFLSKV